MATPRTRSVATAKSRLFIVDDHAIARFGMAQLINVQRDLVVCGESESAKSALKLIPQSNPDLVIADITLQDGNGIELVRTLTARHPAIRVLVVSMHEESLNAELALQAGARGYIMKQEAVDRLLEAIRQVLGGKVYLSEAAMQKLLEDRMNRPASKESTPVASLSSRELQVFQMIGQWRRTRDIAQHLHLSIKTVEYYRHRIKEKLGLENATALTHFATEWMQRLNPGLGPSSPSSGPGSNRA
jgi:DNA-binding NarL/FixJ family response regulator